MSRPLALIAVLILAAPAVADDWTGKTVKLKESVKLGRKLAGGLVRDGSALEKGQTYVVKSDDGSYLELVGQTGFIFRSEAEVVAGREIPQEGEARPKADTPGAVTAWEKAEAAARECLQDEEDALADNAEKAEKAFRTAVLLAMEIGPTDFRVAKSLEGLAVACDRCGSRVDAERHVRHAIQIAEKAKGGEAALVDCLGTLRVVCANRGKFAEAVRAEEARLALCEKHFPDRVAGSLAELADLYATWPEAEFRDGRRALEFAKRALEKNNQKLSPLVAIAYAAALNAVDKPKEAEEWLSKAVEASRDSDLRDQVYDRLRHQKAGKPYLRPIPARDGEAFDLGPPAKAVPAVPVLPPLAKPIPPTGNKK